MPGDIAAAKAPDHSAHTITTPAVPVFRPADADLDKLAEMVEAADKVAIFGGDGCRDARAEVLQLAVTLKAPVGFSFRGKQWLEHDNPNAVGMTGLLGYGGAYKAIHEADLVLLLGTDFPFSEFLPGDNVKKAQIDREPKHIGRRTSVDLALVGDIKATVAALLPKVREKTDRTFLERHVAETSSFHELLQHYVEKGPGIKPIRPEFLAATLSELASDDAMFFADTGTACIWLARHVEGGTNRRLFGSFFMGLDGQCRSQRIRCSTRLPRPPDHRALWRRRIRDARPGRPAHLDGRSTRNPCDSCCRRHCQRGNCGSNQTRRTQFE
jgi:pyruvate dehydrogenase (quinone)